MRQRATFVDTAAEDLDVASLTKADRALRRFRELPFELKSKIYDPSEIIELFETTPLDNLENAYLEAPNRARFDPALAAIVVMRNPRLITSIEPSVRVDKEFIEAVNTGICVNVEFESVKLDNINWLGSRTRCPCIQYKDNHGTKKAILSNGGELPPQQGAIIEPLVDLDVRINTPTQSIQEFTWPNQQRRLDEKVPAGTQLTTAGINDNKPNNFLFFGLTHDQQKEVALNLMEIDIDFFFTFSDYPHGFEPDWRNYLEREEYRLMDKEDTIKFDRDVGLTLLQDGKHRTEEVKALAVMLCIAYPDDRALVLEALKCNKHVFDYVSPTLRNDPEVRALANQGRRFGAAETP